MRDKNGKKLELGDKVIFAIPDGLGLSFAHITKFCPSKVKISTFKSNSYKREYQRYAYELVKVVK